jgi:hypothetical protein
MTTYCNNYDTVHAFANRISHSGRNGNGSINFNGNIICSYSTPIAEFVNEDVLLINNEKYSVTTSAHQSLIFNALPYSYDIIAVPYNNSNPSDNISQLNNYSWVFKSFENSLMFFATKLKKAKSKKEDYLNKINEIKANIQKYYNLFSSQIDKRTLSKTIKDILNNQFSMEELQQIENRRLRAEKIKIKRDEAKRKKQIKQAIDDFFDYKSDIVSCHKIYLRFSECKKWVETSQGARIPFDIALKLYSMAENIKKLKNPFNIRSLSLQERKIYNFTLDKIDEEGNTTIGCHFLEFSEMTRLYNEIPKRIN